jgi:hypothetical protein
MPPLGVLGIWRFWGVDVQRSEHFRGGPTERLLWSVGELPGEMGGEGVPGELPRGGSEPDVSARGVGTEAGVEDPRLVLGSQDARVGVGIRQ